jgi:hypothetical protein
MRAQDQPFPTLDGSRWSPITQELDRLIRKEPDRGLYEAARTAWACAPLSGHFFRLGLPKYAYRKRQSEVLRALSDRLSQWILHRDQVLVAVIVLLPLLATPFRGQWNRPPHIYTVPVFMLVTGVGLVMMLRASRAGAGSDREPTSGVGRLHERGGGSGGGYLPLLCTVYSDHSRGHSFEADPGVHDLRGRGDPANYRCLQPVRPGDLQGKGARHQGGLLIQLSLRIPRAIDRRLCV